MEDRLAVGEVAMVAEDMIEGTIGGDMLPEVAIVEATGEDPGVILHTESW